MPGLSHRLNLTQLYEAPTMILVELVWLSRQNLTDITAHILGNVGKQLTIVQLSR